MCVGIYTHIYIYICLCKKVKWSRYRPGVAKRVGKFLALLFHDRDTRRGWVVSSTPRPHFTARKDPVPILQEAGWAPGPVWTGGNSRPHRDSIPGFPARSQSLYRLSYPATYVHMCVSIWIYIHMCIYIYKLFSENTVTTSVVLCSLSSQCNSSVFLSKNVLIFEHKRSAFSCNTFLLII